MQKIGGKIYRESYKDLKGAVAVAVAPVPPPPDIEIVGTLLYPAPAVVIVIDETYL